MRTCLIVTTYNWPGALHLTLASAARQTLSPDHIVVADDGSGPATGSVIERWRARGLPLTHVWQEDDGFRLARSRNRAIAATDADYIVLVDGDMILHPQFVADHVRCARPDLFIQGARPQLSPAMTAQLLRAGAAPNIGPFTPGLQRRPYALRSRLLSRMFSRTKAALGGIQGCNQSFWRSHAIQVNGYDERFTAWGPEDREFVARLLHLGLRRRYVRHMAIAFHLHHASRAPGVPNPFDRLLHETLAQRATWTEHGLTAHLHAPEAPRRDPAQAVPLRYGR
ncbi:MAG TPA: glycosyltransferase family 2 protein [Steroidobacteraceae bacterium]|nr:glycosyltransferase family 2 protein [Steroidobacteraceae bacterium]